MSDKHRKLKNRLQQLEDLYAGDMESTLRSARLAIIDLQDEVAKLEANRADTLEAVREVRNDMARIQTRTLTRAEAELTIDTIRQTLRLIPSMDGDDISGRRG